MITAPKRRLVFIKNKIDIIYKGVLIGSTMLVPGVSGGSMAMILGIYDRLIEAVSSFFKDIKSNALFLFVFVLSAGAGMLLLARPILSLLESYPKTMGFFFIGAVAGGIPAVYIQAQVKGFSWKYVIYIIVGLVGVVVLSLLPTDYLAESVTEGSYSGSFLFIAGVVAAAALILPGISVSYLLLIMGLYHELMRAISEIDVAFLFPMGIGLLCGILLLTKGLEFVMTRYPQVSYLTILGFVIGSLAEVFPGMPVGTEWILCVLAAMIGFYFIFTLSKSEVS